MKIPLKQRVYLSNEGILKKRFWVLRSYWSQIRKSGIPGRFPETIEHIGLCFEAGELIEDAVPLFDKFDLIEKLLNSETEMSEHLSSLDDSLMNFGRMCEGEEYLEEEYIEEAKRVYDRAIEIYGKVLDKDPENSETKVYLSYIYRYMAGMYSDQENLVKAEECYKEALGLLESEIENEPENIPVSENIEVSENISVPKNILFSMAIADMYKDSGLIFSDTEDTTKARDYYTKARETFRGLIDKYPDLLGADKNLAISLDELAELFQRSETSKVQKCAIRTNCISMKICCKRT